MSKLPTTAEKTTEKRLKGRVERLGGLALKLFSPWFTGLPDRLILLPRGRIYFVELKKEGKKPSPRQAVVHKLLTRLGFTVVTIDSPESLDYFLEML